MRPGVSRADAALSLQLGVPQEVVADIRRRLVEGVHYTAATRNPYAGLSAPLEYTRAGIEAVRLRLLAGVVQLKVAKLCQNRTWVKVAVPGEGLRALQVRDNRGLKKGMTLRCCVLPHEIENLDRNQIPRSQINHLPIKE